MALELTMQGFSGYACASCQERDSVFGAAAHLIVGPFEEMPNAL
jgi:hypothetical protein